MFGFERLLSSRRRRAAPAPCQRIEPTLPDPLAPSSGKVRLRIRYNDAFAVAATEQEAALHGVSTADHWTDCWRGDEASRELVVDVPVPRFAEPAPSRIAVDPVPVAASAVEPPPIPHRPAAEAAPTPVPTPARTLQPTLSPLTHAEHLLAWCRRRDLVGEVIIFDMERAYAAMCAEEGIVARPWNPVSRELTVLLTGQVGKKSYAMFQGEKRRVFRIPASEHGLLAGAQSRAHDVGARSGGAADEAPSGARAVARAENQERAAA